MPDGFEMQDVCKVEVVETPNMSPEHAAELDRRRSLAPQQWYPIALSPNWNRFLQSNGWLKMVYSDATVVIGRVMSHYRPVVRALAGTACQKVVQVLDVSVYKNTLLVNGDIADDWVGTPEQIVQAFTDDKAISEASKND